jgi:hypothetical protein
MNVAAELTFLAGFEKAGAKALIILAVTARLKSCPDTGHLVPGLGSDLL